jgi:Protein of unknown function (DUF3005)
MQGACGDANRRARFEPSRLRNKFCCYFNHVIFEGESMMNSNDASKAPDSTRLPGTVGPSSAELHNDRTHDSTVDTDGKNLEAARLAGHSAIGPDEVTTTNATLVNSVPEARDGLGGFDSRVGGNHVLLALEPGYTVIDKGMIAPQSAYGEDHQYDDPDDPRPMASRQDRGRIHFALNHMRPTRVIELRRTK